MGLVEETNDMEFIEKHIHPADIKKLQDEIIALYKAVNQLIDVDAEQNKKLDNAVYYKE